jgi:hypothetical protein
VVITPNSLTDASPTERANYKKIGGAAAASGNATATYKDVKGDQWIGKQSTLQKTVTEVVAQRLATEVLGAGRAPETVLANDGTLFSKKPAGDSDNLGDFFADPDNLSELSSADKSQIQDSFLDALVFKIVSGDSDIIPENFVLDRTAKAVLPIDGENAFIGLVAGDSGELENWTEAQFNEFMDDPGAFVEEFFSDAGIEAGFLSENIDENTLLGKFVATTNALYNDNYSIVDKVVQQTDHDLVAFDGQTKKLSNDSSLKSDLKNNFEGIKVSLRNSVEQLYSFAENRFYAQ